jgi:hypothetical protein
MPGSDYLYRQAYLTDWRKGSKNVFEVPQQVKDALKELMQRYQHEPAASSAAVALRAESEPGVPDRSPSLPAAP